MENLFILSMKALGYEVFLGGKGANLAEMTKIGLPVPFGYYFNGCLAKTISTRWNIIEIVKKYMTILQNLNVVGKTFGDVESSSHCRLDLELLYRCLV